MTNEPKTENTPAEYEERLVVFIDILGFKDMIDKPELIRRIFKKFNKIFNDEIKNLIDEKMPTYQYTQFSDNIIISIKTNNENHNLFMILNILRLLQQSLIHKHNNKIFLRGGIVIGKLIHTENFQYGPALIEAHKIESETAIYPRILIEEKTYNTLLEIKDNDKYDYNKYIKKYIKCDFDGNYFIDYLAIYPNKKITDEYCNTFYNEVYKIITQLIKNKNDKKILQKYRWVKSKILENAKGIIK